MLWLKKRRMAVLKEYRKRGIGRMLVNALTEYAIKENISEIKCNAQEYIQAFYKAFGFKVVSEQVFMEEGIPHVLMSKKIHG